MSSKTGSFDATCPQCGQQFKAQAVVDAAHADSGTVQTVARCPHCRTDVTASADLDCLEWDNACTSEQGRIG